MGSQAYGSNYNAVARAFDAHLASLGGIRIVMRGEGDTDEDTVSQQFNAWTQELLQKLGGTPSQQSEADEVQKVDLEAEFSDAEESDSDSDADSEVFEDAMDKEIPTDNLVDLEDVVGLRNLAEPAEPGRKRGVVRKQPLQKGVQSVSSITGVTVPEGPKEMVTPILRANLEKQVILHCCSFICMLYVS